MNIEKLVFTRVQNNQFYKKEFSVLVKAQKGVCYVICLKYLKFTTLKQ